jgi:1-deoxy-D-xylulose-5-phosphate synthase
MHGLNVTLVLDRAGVTGPDGASHHGVFDLSYLRMIPGISIAAPSNAEELCGVFEAALHHEGPVAIRFPKGNVAAIPTLPVPDVPFGEWDVVARGDDVLLLAAGKPVEAATKAAAALSEAGVSSTVVNARWVKPMDERLVEWAAGHRLVVTIEDNVGIGGFGAGVMEQLAPHGLAGRVRTMAVPDRFLRFGNQTRILEELGLSADAITERVITFVAEG